jgi:hypothetical protein
MPQTKELTRDQVRELLGAIEAAPTPEELDRLEQMILRDYGATPAQRLANELALRDLREAIATRRGIPNGPHYPPPTAKPLGSPPAADHRSAR